MVKDGRIELRLDSNVLDGIKALAEKDKRSLSDYLRLLLVDHLKATSAK